MYTFENTSINVKIYTAYKYANYYLLLLYKTRYYNIILIYSLFNAIFCFNLSF